ncbi:MAG: hypothetical protein GY925_02590, partial [Actinomycetia bacterium]|nr:hypothetical protein [Actinomycetes bacterium]
MREMVVPFYGAEELDNMERHRLDALVRRQRFVRARMDGHEALLLSAIDRADRRAANSKRGKPDPDENDTDTEDSEDSGDPGHQDEKADEDEDSAPPLSRKAEREAAERAKRLEAHPDVAAALAEGRINTEQADAITKADLPADVKTRLLQDAYGQNADETREAVNQAIKDTDADNADKRLKRQRKARRGSCGINDQNMIWINAQFDPVTGAVIKAEYDRRESAAYHHDIRTITNPAKRRTHAQRGADVIASMILDGIIPAATDTNNEAEPDDTRPEVDPFDRAQPQLNLILTPDTINNPNDPLAVAYTLDGAPVPASLATGLICTAQINAWVLTADRKHLDLGYNVELATPHQKTALAIRDQTCRWRGCNREGSRCEAHHLKHREHAGPTDLSNLALLCPYHHDRLHQLKLHLRMGETADHWQLKD